MFLPKQMHLNWVWPEKRKPYQELDACCMSNDSIHSWSCNSNKNMFSNHYLSIQKEASENCRNERVSFQIAKSFLTTPKALKLTQTEFSIIWCILLVQMEIQYIINYSHPILASMESSTTVYFLFDCKKNFMQHDQKRYSPFWQHNSEAWNPYYGFNAQVS